MHFLDDRGFMDLKLYERSTEYVCLAKLALGGGNGALDAALLAKSLRTRAIFVQVAITGLVKEGLIKKTEGNRYEIVDFHESSIGKKLNIVQPDAPCMQVAPRMKFIRYDTPPTPASEAFLVLKDYRARVSTAGNYMEAAEAIDILLKNGWTPERLQRCTEGYARSCPKYALSATNFFLPAQPEGGGIYFAGEVYELTAAKLAPPVADEIAQMKALLGRRQAGGDN